MNLKKVIMIVVVLTCLSGLFAGTNAKVLELLKLTKSDQMLEQYFQQMKSMQQQQLMGMEMTDAQKAVMNKYNDKLFNKLKTVLKWEAIKDDFIKIYTSNFTDEQIDDLLKFYQSETGKVFIDKMPQVMQASMQIGQMKVQAISQDLMSISQEMVQELQALEQAKQ